MRVVDTILKKFRLVGHKNSILENEGSPTFHKEVWDSNMGLWDGGSYNGFRDEEVDGVKITGALQDTLQQIDNLLATSDEPIVIADVGAMMGVGLVMIAHIRSDLVESGKLVLVGTNIDFVPDAETIREIVRKKKEGKLVTLDYAESPYGNFCAALSLRELEVYSDNLDKVQFIQTNIDNLATMSIEVGGKKTPIAGSVDILHEAHVLIHISDVEKAVMSLTSALSQRGTLIIESTDGKIHWARLNNPSGIIKHSELPIFDLSESINAAHNGGLIIVNPKEETTPPPSSKVLQKVNAPSYIT